MAEQIEQVEKIEQVGTMEQTEKINIDKKYERPSYDNISLDVVEFKRTFIRNRGTISQVIKSLSDMKERLNNPQNEYQKGLYPKICDECESVVSKYSEMVDNIDKTNYKLFGYYLNGGRNNGSCRPTRSRNENKKYELSEYKETLNTIDSRLRYMKINCIRKIRDTTRFDDENLQKVIDFSDELHTFIQEKLKNWVDFLDLFRKERGVIIKKHVTVDKKTKYNKNSKDSKDSKEKKTGKKSSKRSYDDKKSKKTFNKD
jgi:hypothetical protein